MSSPLPGPCRILEWTSKFTCNIVESSLGGEACAISEMMGHVALLRELYSPFVVISPGVVGMEGCESFSTRLENDRLEDGKMIAERYLARYFLCIKQFSEGGELGNVYWLPAKKPPRMG